MIPGWIIAQYAGAAWWTNDGTSPYSDPSAPVMSTAELVKSDGRQSGV